MVIDGNEEVDDDQIAKMKDGLDQMFEETLSKVCTMNSN